MLSETLRLGGIRGTYCASTRSLFERWICDKRRVAMIAKSAMFSSSWSAKSAALW